LLHRVLIDELRRARPKPGELVLVKWLGKKTSASGQEYVAYRVLVDREDQGVDWAALGEPSEEGPSAEPEDDIPF
jgi:hypothetical protein